MKQTPAISAFCALALMAASCSDDNGMDSSLDLYQQYEVVVADEGNAAFANFRVGSATGERIELTNGTNVVCNKLTMWFDEPQSLTQPEFTYSCTLDKNHKKAIFTFTRSHDSVLVNEVVFDSVLPVGLPEDLEEMKAGEEIRVAIPAQPNADVTYVAKMTGGSAEEKNVAGYVDVARGMISFPSLGNGNYTLTVDAVRTVATTANDGSAGGAITLIRRVSRKSVHVVI